ncbi:unnamed protein product [Cuscuta epithymum]|uniref:Uncharacterized protein n=1 Tax=Cuscuta epithymum TaxID=186058 RepID=A0AAV0DH52_9ASTE|nr:unnamed protein product [Cuscuta epithymum]
MGSLRSSVMVDKEEELVMFNEMRRREKEQDNLLLLQKPDDFDDLLGSKDLNSSFLNDGAYMPAQKTVSDELLNSDNDKNDYDWLISPPGTPLFPSLEMESQKTVMSQLGTLKARPTALKSRLANPPGPTVGNNLTLRHPHSSYPGLNTSIPSFRRPSSPGGSRPLSSTNRPTQTTSTKPQLNNTVSKTSTSTKSSRAVTPTRGLPSPSTKPMVNPRSSIPTRQPIPGSKPTSRAATPTRQPSSSSIASKSSTAASPATKKTAPQSAGSPSVKPKPWKPSDIPGLSLNAPANLMTSIPPDRPPVSRGRPGIPGPRSSSVESVGNGRVRRQSCSPARGRPPNRTIANGSGSSVPIPAMSRLHAKANHNVSPVLVGAKMVERVVNMRKLVPPRQDEKQSPNSNISAKSSSPESLGFGRNLSKKSLDMAIRHMDIRRAVPSNLRPSMANISASSRHSLRTEPSGTNRSVTISGSPHAMSSNASSEVSVTNAPCRDANEVDDDDISSYKVAQFSDSR